MCVVYLRICQDLRHKRARLKKLENKSRIGLCLPACASIRIIGHSSGNTEIICIPGSMSVSSVGRPGVLHLHSAGVLFVSSFKLSGCGSNFKLQNPPTRRGVVVIRSIPYFYFKNIVYLCQYSWTDCREGIDSSEKTICVCPLITDCTPARLKQCVYLRRFK
jgi:hypothetical protein